MDNINSINLTPHIDVCGNVVAAHNGNIQQNINKDINSLSEKDKVAFEIAYANLGSSFEIEKTAGFIEWQKTQNK